MFAVRNLKKNVPDPRAESMPSTPTKDEMTIKNIIVELYSLNVKFKIVSFKLLNWQFIDELCL